MRALLAALAAAPLLVAGAARARMPGGQAAFGQAPSAGQAAASSYPNSAQPATPVVVELFTSEGCSSCPPADRLLAQLEQNQPVPGAQIIALEEHVDYWNSQGWSDPFSSVQFTNRQADYVDTLHTSTAYTPEMVVDGATAFVGNNERAALAAIAKASGIPNGRITLEPKPDSNADAKALLLRIQVEPAPDWHRHDEADVVVVITENGLSSNVTRGENAGVRLSHRAVVRELRVIGHVDPTGSFAAEPDLKVSKNWQRANLRAVVFVQMRKDRHIVSAAAVPLSGE